MNALELKYINIESSFYKEAVALREHLFFQNMDNSCDLIHDDFELKGIHLVCLKENEVVGAGRLNIKDEVSMISQIATKKEYQQRGIGTKILKELIKKSKEKKATKIELSAREKAIAFYEKFGFIAYGHKYPSKKTGIIHQKMKLKTD